VGEEDLSEIVMSVTDFQANVCFLIPFSAQNDMQFLPKIHLHICSSHAIDIALFCAAISAVIDTYNGATIGAATGALMRLSRDGL
jgi:hypothetical protein